MMLITVSLFYKFSLPFSSEANLCFNKNSKKFWRSNFKIKELFSKKDKREINIKLSSQLNKCRRNICKKYLFKRQ